MDISRPFSVFFNTVEQEMDFSLSVIVSFSYECYSYFHFFGFLRVIFPFDFDGTKILFLLHNERGI